MQTSYNPVRQKGVAGGLVTAESSKCLTAFSEEKIPFGRIVSIVSADVDMKVALPSSEHLGGTIASVRDITKQNNYYNPHESLTGLYVGMIWVESEEAIGMSDSIYVRFNGKKQVQTIVFDADLITANVVTLTVNGVDLTQEFDSSHSDTMDALAAKIAAVVGVESAEVDTRTITVTSEVMGDEVLIEDVLVSDGLTQAGAVVTETVNAIPLSDRGKIRGDDDDGTCTELKDAVVNMGFGDDNLVPLMFNVP